MNVPTSNNYANLTKNAPKTSYPKIDYSGLGILFGMIIQAFALIPIIIKVSINKSAQDISIVTPMMMLFSFILFSVISFLKKFYFPLFIFIIGIVVSGILITQKVLFETSISQKNQAPVINLQSLPRLT